MSTTPRALGAIVLVGSSLSSCSGTPSAVLPMSGKWQWANINPSHPQSLDQDNAICVGEADAIQARINHCSSTAPSDCEKMPSNIDPAMCEYANTTTNSICSVERILLPKQEIVGGCLGALGWKQKWIKSVSLHSM